MTGDSKRAFALSPKKRELLEALLQEEGVAPLVAPKISRRKDDTPPPLSFAQQRLWFMDQLAPGNLFYNVDYALRLRIPLSVTVMERSLNEIVRRHEAMRTTFREENGEPRQVIAPVMHLALPVRDLQHLPELEREAEALRLATEEARRVFDLTRGPLVRTMLLRLGEVDYVFLLEMHHIVCDGWSINVFFRELSAVYQAFCTGEPSPLPELPVQYADFAVWQRQWLQEEILESQLAYWKKQLADLPILQLPTDRPRPQVQSFQGARQPVVIPKQLVADLQALSQREQVTLFMTLLAAFKVLLHRYTGQNDIVVGAPIANRNRAEIEGLIGFFVNNLVMRSDLSGDPSFLELLRRVRETALEAYSHQDLPFEQLVEELHPARDTSRNPLFQVTFQLYSDKNSSQDRTQDAGLSLLGISRGTAIFDLAFSLGDSPEGLSGRFEYSTALFDAATIARMAGHFQVLLEAIIENPERRLSQLAILTEAERQQLLAEWNHTEVQYPANASLHRLFEAQVTRTPNAVAVVFDGAHLTYRELNRRANQLAHSLMEQRVGPDTRVAICMERSLEMVVGLLGILKAGGGYVPLDPAYPKQRLTFMLEDSQAHLLLTQRGLLDRVPPRQPTPVCLDLDWPVCDGGREANPTGEVNPDSAAYVIYTSGSTGRPKGVVISHRAICNHMFWMQEAFPLNEADRVLQRTPLSFDASVWEFYAPLLSGARLVMLRPAAHSDCAELIRVISEEEVTILQLVPSLLRVLIEEPAIETCRCLRRVFCGGEALTAEIRDRFKARLGANLCNLYGPTESSIDTTSYCCRDVRDEGFVPIGRPISNTQVYVLDPRLNLVPIGVPGELHIGGNGLARGYLNRPELTAEKFIPNPFGAAKGSRLYKTGDLVRHRPDGNIEFFGRLDHQVKLRGFRIEMSEVESVLREDPGVQEAVVLARQDGSGDQQLVAYVVQPAPSQSTEGQELNGPESEEQIAQWETVFNETLDRGGEPEDPTFNIIGWNSSYNGLPIPADEMREQVEQTAERILRLGLSRGLEIGCGAGLLLFRLAPHCTHYCGTDFSFVALDYVGQQLKRLALPQVGLLQRRADEFEGLRPEGFDGVILNSVVQYFPSIDYLVRVLEGAARMMSPDGFIFVGDVRSLPLLEVFNASVELHRAPASMPILQLRQRIRKKKLQEKELVVAPDFFRALPQYLPQINQVQVLLKRGGHHNELTRFRYDVILHTGAQTNSAPDCLPLDWQEEGLSLEGLSQLLKEARPERLRLIRVPNARLVAEMEALALLNSEPGPDTVSEVRALQQSFQGSGVDPEAVWALGDQFGYSVEIGWSDSDSDANGCFEALLRQSAREEKRRILFLVSGMPPLRPWHHYANNPQGTQSLVPRLRRLLQGRLPDHMVPSTFVLLDALPLTPNGKLDRQALPDPDTARPEQAGTYVAPQNPVEEIVAAMWSELLNLERVGANDNFFELGGHSLLAMRLVSRIRQTFKMDLPLRIIFEASTLAGFSHAIMQALVAHIGNEALGRNLAELGQLSEDEVDRLLAADSRTLTEKRSNGRD